MLGEQIYESRGKRTGRRVLCVEGGFKVEVSFEGGGKLLGVDVTEIGTYWSESRPDGSLYGEGQGSSWRRMAPPRHGRARAWESS